MDNLTVTFPDEMKAPGDPPILLADKIKANPGAYDFSDIPLTAPSDLEMDDALLTLQQAIGEFSPAGDSGFFVRSPKLREQLAVAKAVNEINAAQSANDEYTGMMIFVRLAETLFFIEQGEGYRPATQKELTDGFSIDELIELIRVNVGLTMSGKSGPNA
jgi:hypothetical protein